MQNARIIRAFCGYTARLQVVAALVVQCQVEADGLFFVAHAQAHNHVDHLEDHIGDDGGVHHGESHTFELDKELRADVFHRAKTTQCWRSDR